MSKTLSKRQQQARHNRDGGRFLALPHVVMESEAFKSLTGHQVKMLLDVAMQLNAGNANNGRLTAGWKYLSEDRGWTSKNTVKRSLDALIERGLLFRTRIGRFPNTLAWYAVTWAPLHHHPEMDCGEQALPRGEYARWRTTQN